MRRQPSPNQQQPEAETVARLNDLLRVVRQREQNYFKVVDFIKRNIDSLGRQMEQLTIVHKFLSSVDAAEAELTGQEQVLINQPSNTAPHCKKLVGRMVVRLFELFEVSLNRVRGTYFCGERHEGDYLALRTHLNKSLGLEALQFGIVAHAVLNYSRSKFNAEVERLRRYLYKIEHGADIDLKRYYMGTEDMDSDHSPDRNQREGSLKKKNSDSRKQSKDSNRQKKDQSKFNRSSEKQDSPSAGRTATVSKIMKLYNVLDPSRTQFLEDMVYTESEEAHRSRLLNNLWEKNRAIDEQIKEYHKKVQFMADKIRQLKQPQPKSDCQASDHNSAERSRSNMFRSEASIKTNNFIISKPKKELSLLRKSRRDLTEDIVGEQTDFIVNSAGEYSSGAQYASDTGMYAPYTDRGGVKPQATKRPVSKALLKRKGFPNLGSRPSSRSGLNEQPLESQPTKQMKSKSSSKNNRIFIVKSPTLFEDQTLQSRMVIVSNTGTILNKKQSQLNATKLRNRPSNKRMSRSVLVRQQRPIERPPKPQRHQQKPDMEKPPQADPLIKSIFNDKPPMLEDGIIFDSQRVRQFGARKQFNLRLKKHMKKNILVSDRLFIEQTNEQINSYNF